MSKHTPGPWTIREPGYIEARTRNGRNVYVVGYAYNREIAPACKRDEVDANAKLIAASPLLFDACLTVLATLVDWDRDDGEAGEALREALSIAGWDGELP
jgi:hypothetical protein